MADKSTDMETTRTKLRLVSDRRGGGDHTGGGREPPEGGDLEKRVAELEKTSQEIREKLVRVDGKLETIEKLMAKEATLAEVRADLARDLGSIRTNLAEETGTINQSIANFRTEITRVEGSMIKWFIVTALTLMTGSAAIAFGLARALPH
ncbi:nucleotide exchange factor GrpE [Metapseudomonas otitidis]|uniref:nucleotide exchange factor GrpE n=1 Tax=Metapseudomonas otitidis TaxID=319939 RepID=UPI0013F668B5|nr:nucleotide exchange factor GrpE [Pseudomonas otitidis]